MFCIAFQAIQVCLAQQLHLLQVLLAATLVACRDIAEGQPNLFEFPFAIEGDKVGAPDPASAAACLSPSRPAINNLLAGCYLLLCQLFGAWAIPATAYTLTSLRCQRISLIRSSTRLHPFATSNCIRSLVCTLAAGTCSTDNLQLPLPSFAAVMMLLLLLLLPLLRAGGQLHHQAVHAEQGHQVDQST